jgi:hypothetical protein
MRTGEIDILIVPDWGHADPDHWQSRWERNLRTARWIEPDGGGKPDKDCWVGCIIGAVATRTRPVVLVGHGLGVAAIAHASAKLLPGSIAGAFLVGPVDVDDPDPWPETARHDSSAHRGFAPMPLDPLPFPSRLIASSTDPYCSIERAQQLGSAWGSDLSVIANAGHLDSESGHGPWPEGLLTFGVFLKQLG